MKIRALCPTLIALALTALPAEAQYRLRADAYAAGAGTASGFLMLQGETRGSSWLDAETVVWLGTGDTPANVLVASVRARHPKGYGEVRVGRMLVMTGAIRPAHVDGASVAARAPWGTGVEAFGGVPVSLDYTSRAFDWIVGGRVSQRILDRAVLGVSYLQRRSSGAVAFEELGFDAAITPVRWLDAAATAAVDVFRPGLTDARVSIGIRPLQTLRIEAYGVQRSPSHLLPATSLFAALGDVPSRRAGASVFFRVAPRLDLTGDGAVESLGGDLGSVGFVRATLRLDDKGARAIALEARRQSVPLASWTGVRVVGHFPFARVLAIATELELAVPDEGRGRGSVWPWGLVALQYKPEPLWEVAGAFEASSSPSNIAALRGLIRVSRAWEIR